jgi:hypothetical protein
MEYEQSATESEYVCDKKGPFAPVQPPGKGWRLVTAIKVGFYHGETQGVIWYWEREKPSRSRKVK